MNSTNHPQSDVQPENTVAEVAASNTEVQQSVQFSDQAPIQELDVSNSIVQNNPYEFPTLDEYLSRVYPIEKFVWTSSDIVGSKISEIYFPDVFFQYRAILEKLSRFAYMKCNFHIAVRANGTKFHYGKLIIAFNVASYRAGSVDYTSRDNIWSVSAYPHVIVDAGENEVQEFDIPFIYPLDYYPLDPDSSIYGYDSNRSVDPMASVFAYVLNPLSAGAGVIPDVSVTIYGNMTDIKLAGYANSIPIVQHPKITREELRAINADRPQIVDNPVLERSIEFKAQIGTERMRLALPDLNKASDYSIQNDVVDTVPTVSADFPRDYEATTFSNIISKEALLYTGIITSAASEGEDIYSWNVNPTSTSAITYTNGILYYETPLSMVSTSFTYWRGSINYKLQFVASQFHSLRLQLLYVPNGSSYTIDEPFELLSRVIDIQRDTEFKFSIPYTDIFPYTNGSYGRLYLKVVNPLTFKETPIPDIYFNIWISGGSDMTFHVPRNKQRFDLTTPVPLGSFKAQIGTNSSEPHESIYPPLAPFKNYTPTTTFNPVELDHLLHKPILTTGVGEPTGGGVNFMIGYPEGAAATIGNTFATAFNSLYEPWFYYFSRLFRYRTGGVVYYVLKYTIPSPDNYTQSSASLTTDFVVTSDARSGIWTLVTTTEAERFESETKASFVARSSDLAMQPLVVKCPNLTGLNFLMNALGNNSTGASTYNGFLIPRSVITITTTSEFLVYFSGADDTKLHFQLGPPATFISTP